MKRLKFWLTRILASTLILLTLFTIALWIWLRGSLPVLEGKIAVEGINSVARIERDIQGLVTIHSESVDDVFFALGFVHAQERFFQMDLQRRSAAGELSELFGSLALERDKQIRVHRFKHLAQERFRNDSAAFKGRMDQYSLGVNAGLKQLGNPPFEYTLLGAEPRPWVPADSYLTLYSMILTLQDENARYERALGLIEDVLPADLAGFFTVQGGSWDAPLTGDVFPDIGIPAHGFESILRSGADIAYQPWESGDELPGSNNWAVAGHLTHNGAALVANDMHLPIRSPNIWFRASWRHPETGRMVTGVTLPGAPAMVAGSNGRVAWSFTNSEGDFSDVIRLRPGPQDNTYLTPQGPEPFAVVEETIRVKDAEAVTLQVQGTRWGPVIGTNHAGESLVLHWTAHQTAGVNYHLAHMGVVNSVSQALELAPTLGIPQQNLVMGDVDGNIAWVLAGPVPKRTGLDGRTPGYWDIEGVGWDGFYSADQQPKVVNPASGRLWTANARVASGEDLRKLGTQGIALGARAQQIRDGLLAADRFTEKDMLNLQLDDRAVFLQRWQALLIQVLEQSDGSDQPLMADALPLVRNWSARASIDDVGYRLVRGFRFKTLELVTAPLETALRSYDDSFRISHINRQMEYPVWALLNTRPPHLLNPDFDSWDELLQTAAKDLLEALTQSGPLKYATWGEANRVSIAHPLAGAVPPVDWWLSMPDDPVSGDSHMPKVQRPWFAASERFAVSPGHEQSGYLHMATGQSGHPLSPFLKSGHEDWVKGLPSPFMPGETAYELTLTPASASKN